MKACFDRFEARVNLFKGKYSDIIFALFIKAKICLIKNTEGIDLDDVKEYERRSEEIIKRSEGGKISADL